MENGCNLFNNSSTSTGGRGQNGNFTNVAWNIWESAASTTTSSNHHWRTANNPHNSFHHHNLTTAVTPTAAATSTSAIHQEGSAYHALLYSHQGSSSPHLCAEVGSQYHPDPHLMCLKLGKRNYFEDVNGPSMRHVAGFSISKRGKPYYGGGMVGPDGVTVAIPAVMPRCQVEGCNVALLKAKDYHRRHKVCEVHSKAPRVVVLGLEQRFCQQCSRFHVVTEFDDSKRSCRRRLAGHNERRRKSSHELSVSRNNPSQGRFPYLSPPDGRALSLLSSRNEPLISSHNFSSRCSSALHELIAENRAALLARQLIGPFHPHAMEDLNGHQNEPHQHQIFPEPPPGWDRYNGTTGMSNLTLDLMQAPTSEFELLSMRGKPFREEGECSQLWSSFGGTHVV